MSVERISQSIQASDLSSLEQRAEKIEGALGKIRRVSATLGTPQFEPQTGKEFPQFDAINPSNPRLIENSIRVGIVNRNLLTKAQPSLLSLNEEVQQRHSLLRKEEEEKQAQIQKAREELNRLLELKDFIPNPEVAILSARERLKILTGELATEAQTAQVSLPQRDAKTEKEKTSEITLPSGKKLRGKKAKILEELLSGSRTIEQLAVAAYGDNSLRRRNNISAFLRFIEQDLFNTEYELQRSFVGQGKEKRVIISLIKKPENVERKEVPFMHPVKEERLKALILIAAGATIQETLDLLGKTKRGIDYNNSEARSALWSNLAMLKIRITNRKATSDELRVWEIIKTAVGNPADDREAFQEFKKRIYEFYHGKRQTEETSSQALSYSPEEKEFEGISSYEGAVLARLILDHDKITLKNEDGKEMEFELPEEIRENCNAIIEKHKEDYDGTKVENLDELRQKILDKISDAFEGDVDEALRFVELHNNSLQEVLYWLESERQYIFELLVHHVETTNTVDSKKLDLLRQARTVAGLQNGAVKALEKRLGSQRKTNPAVTEPTEEPKNEISKVADEQSDHQVLSSNRIIVPTGEVFQMPDRYPELRNEIREILKEVMKKAEFSSGSASMGQLPRAFPVLTATYISRLIEKDIIKPDGKNGRTKFSPVDAAIALLMHRKAGKLTNTQIKYLKKAASQEFERIKQ